jgi:2-polyprenyl-3-methyl-5-hydroxy-6-metoxy-1,4-benzoquinol methylase
LICALPCPSLQHQEYDITDIDIHNAFQRLTWDASADARAFRGNADLSSDMQLRLDTALKYAAEPVLESGKNGRILDVGSGTGVLVGELKKQGLVAENIVGLDISPEMTRVAAKAWPGVTFVTSDFWEYKSDNPLDTVLFCMSLHDLPNAMRALGHAASLLRPGGRIVISHPRGSSHVLMQHRKNPIMVPHTLPTSKDIELLCQEETSLKVLLEPSEPGDASDVAEGYLCILEKSS